MGRSVRVNVSLFFFYYFCFSVKMASNKRHLDTQRPTSSKQPRINVTDQQFESLVMETLAFSESDDSSADEDDILPQEAEVDSSSDSDDNIPLAELQSETGIEEAVPYSDSDEPTTSQESTRKYYYGKRRCMKWAKDPPSRNRRTPAHNIVIPMASVNVPAESEPVSLFNLFLSPNIKNKIILHTNERLEILRQKYKRTNKPELRDIDEIEFDAFLGMLLFSAAFKSNDEDVNAIFATDGTGRDIFRAVMSKDRFQMILIALRFDDFSTRDERKLANVAAAVSEIFEIFVSNCQKYYRLGDNTTIDEMLVSFRGRCRWKKYMPNKPCKYGLEIKCLTDGRTGYLYNAYLYTGMNSDGLGLSETEKKLLLPSQCVVRLSKPIQNTNRNITADNYFSSIEVCCELKKVGLTYVGTVKKNKREIPLEFLQKNRTVKSTMYGFTKDITLLSYVPKRNKTVIMVSTMHHDQAMDVQKEIPEIISFYNTSKGGVDSLDEKCAKYSCSRRTRRWPMVIFYRIVDIAAVNAFILSNYKAEDRLIFMKNAAKSLVRGQLERRIIIPQLSLELKGLLTRILGTAAIPRTEEESENCRLNVRKNCHLCYKQKHRKTSVVCHVCKKPVCLQCSKPACNTCR